MKKWIDYCEKNSENLLRPAKGYGDWVSIASNTPKDVIGTAYFAYSTKLLSEMAYNVGFLEDGEKYEKLFNRLKKAFNDAYVQEDGTIKGNTQTCYAMALTFDLLSDENREKAGRHLYERVKDKNWHLSTGFVGLSYLLPSLTATGNLDVAYKLLLNDTFPSWGYSIKNGATTIWERWDGWTEDKGFQTPGMNSFNHYAFGSVGRWMIGTVAGIDTIGNGYKNIIIKPQPGGGLTYVNASYDSINGLIKSGWKIDNGQFKLDITIPANTTAMVYVPTVKIEKDSDIEKMYSDKEFVRFIRTEEGFAVFEVGSGKYRFQSRI
jgi:alpha-L-rhamnosidase